MHQSAGAAQVGQGGLCMCHGPPMAYTGPPLSCMLPGRQVGRADDTTIMHAAWAPGGTSGTGKTIPLSCMLPGRQVGWACEIGRNPEGLG